jgi:signal transduction histidine kinase
MTGSRLAISARRLAAGALEAALRVPLVTKLAGANIIIVATTIVAAALTFGATNERERLIALAIALVLGLAVNALLVALALRPLRMLEETAARISAGDLTARVPTSPLADRDLSRTRRAVNRVLDDLAAERTRIRRLASLALKAQDDERLRVARELNDSTAQVMAAVAMELSAAAREVPDPDLREQLARLRDAAGHSVEEIRTLAHSVYPRVLQDLGLAAALERLARLTRDSSGVETYVTVATDPVPANVAAVLYRVAQESLANAVRHASPSMVQMRVFVDDSHVNLHVVDDGIGFDPGAAMRHGAGTGIFSMRERVALAGGTFGIVSTPGGDGTRVTARLPLFGAETP